MEKGMLIPLITPFGVDGSVDYKGLKNAARFAFASPAEGVYAMGSSAECFKMTVEERKKCLEVVLGESGSKTVMAHIGHVGQDIAVDLARHAERAGASGIASVPPFYFRYSYPEIKDYFCSLADAVKIPLTVYNVPALTCALSLENIADIMRHDNISSIKFTDLNYYMLERIKTVTGKYVYSGADEGLLSALAAGADGAIGTSMNYAAETFIEIRRRYTAGDMQGALKEQQKLNTAVKRMLDGGKFVASVKYLMTLRGVEMESQCRRPYTPLTDAERSSLKEFYETQFII